MTLNTCSVPLSVFENNTAVIPRDHENAQPYLRAIVDHTERREREAQAEGEQGGVVLLEARDLRADIRLFKDNRLLSFKPVLRIEDHRGESPYQDIGSYQIVQPPRPTEATNLTRSRGRRKTQQIYTKPDGDGFDELAWELDQYAPHADLNDLEKITLGFMPMMLARLITKSPKCWASLRATTQSFRSRSRLTGCPMVSTSYRPARGWKNVVR